MPDLRSEVDPTSGTETGPSTKSQGTQVKLSSGAIAGVVSVLVFTAVHYVLISDIWSMTGVMATAGALAGLCIAWSFRRLAASTSASTWYRYNAAFVALFAVIPAVSVVVFEPVMTFAEAANSDGPLDDLIGQALPLTIALTLIIAGLVASRFGRFREHFAPMLLTTAVLMLLLGLNLTIVGLVEFTGNLLVVVIEFIALILGIGLVYSLTFHVLERRRFQGR